MDHGYGREMTGRVSKNGSKVKNGVAMRVKVIYPQGSIPGKNGSGDTRSIN